jgi:hypothetical protein
LPNSFFPLPVFFSSPNSLKGKELIFSECPVISWARKESHLACNHEADIYSHRWRGNRLFLRGSRIPPPLRFADDQKGVHGKRISRRCLLRNLPFFPGPWQALMKNSINEFGDDPFFSTARMMGKLLTHEYPAIFAFPVKFF